MMLDDQDGCEWVNISSCTGPPIQFQTRVHYMVLCAGWVINTFWSQLDYLQMTLFCIGINKLQADHICQWQYVDCANSVPDLSRMTFLALIVVMQLVWNGVVQSSCLVLECLWTQSTVITTLLFIMPAHVLVHLLTPHCMLQIYTTCLFQLSLRAVVLCCLFFADNVIVHEFFTFLFCLYRPIHQRHL